MTLCTGKKNKYSNEIVVTEVYGVCGEEDHETSVYLKSKKGNLDHKTGLKLVPGGPNGL